MYERLNFISRSSGLIQLDKFLCTGFLKLEIVYIITFFDIYEALMDLKSSLALLVSAYRLQRTSKLYSCEGASDRYTRVGDAVPPDQVTIRILHFGGGGGSQFEISILVITSLFVIVENWSYYH